MDVDNAKVKGSNDDAEGSTSSVPLSPELGTKRGKRHPRNKKCLNISLQIFKRMSGANFAPENDSDSDRTLDYSRVSQKLLAVEERNACPKTNTVVPTENSNYNSNNIITSHRICTTPGAQSNIPHEADVQIIHYDDPLRKSDNLIPKEVLPSNFNKRNLQKSNRNFSNCSDVKVIKNFSTTINYHEKLESKTTGNRNKIKRSSDLESFCQLDSTFNELCDTNILPNEKNDLSLSVLEEICQTSELSFNSNPDCESESNENAINDFSTCKSPSSISSEPSLNIKLGNINLDQKFLNTSNNSIGKYSNIEDNSNLKTDPVIFGEQKKNSSSGSIYVNSANKKNDPIIRPDSIKTLLEYTKLLDDAEPDSYLKETSKQKEFKLLCKQEKLNDGSYLCFENLPNNQKNTFRKKRRESSIPVESYSETNEQVSPTSFKDGKVNSLDTDAHENISFMEKYNIDMNNTLNDFSEHLDDFVNNDIVSESNKRKESSAITSSNKMNTAFLNELHKQNSVEKLINIPDSTHSKNEYSRKHGIQEKSSMMKNQERSTFKMPIASKEVSKNVFLQPTGSKKLGSSNTTSSYRKLDARKMSSINVSVHGSETKNAQQISLENKPINSHKTLVNSELLKNVKDEGKKIHKYLGMDEADKRIPKVAVPKSTLDKARKTLFHQFPEEFSKVLCNMNMTKKLCAGETLSEAKQVISEGSTKAMLNFFSTASGKSVSVTEESLAKARLMLSEKEIDDLDVNEFSSANEKLFSVSEKSLTMAKSMPSDEYDSVFNGFSTASGKSISVSEDSLAKARIMLSEKELNDSVTKESRTKSKNSIISEETTLSKKKSINTTFDGFSTASGKSISVSEDALAKARSTLLEKESDDNILKEFSSASRKSIVSDDALAKERSLLSKKDVTDSTFNGFSTASGKSISVSEEALAKARSLLSEKDVTDSTFNGFSTASGKSISVSAEALAKARSLLSEKDVTDSTFNGFSTASGKSITVSEKALAKARSLLPEKDVTDSTGFNGFSTASGKSISVSEEALAKAKSVLSEKDVTDSTFNGFSTASGKSISVSEEALAKARSLLSEKDVTDSTFNGFSTASGKSITVSEEALAKARSLLPEKDVTDSTGFNGFSTASGKSISVSEEALAKAKSVLSEKDVTDSTFNGFSTASGKSISVSEEALAKAKSLLSEKDVTDSTFNGFSTASGTSISVSEEALAKAKSVLSEKDVTDSTFNGFSTASRKSISVSEEALAKARSLLSEKDVTDSTFNGFSTASGKSISVSEDAVAKARSVLLESPLDDAKIDGFSTASGKSISVSEEALAKARSLLFETPLDDAKIDGFSTASGKSIPVSDEELVKAEKIFNFECTDSSNVEKLDRTSTISLHNRPSPSINVINSSLVKKHHSGYPNNEQSCSSNDHVNSNSRKNCSYFPSRELDPSTRSTDGRIDLQLVESNHFAIENAKSPSFQTQFYEDMPCISLSFVDEVSESTAAFLADEDISSIHDPPNWLKTFVTSPSSFHDRSGPLSPILCSENSETPAKKRACSPILGEGDRFKRRKKRLKMSKRNDVTTQPDDYGTPVSDSKQKPNLEDPYNSFISNLKTSTPISLNRTKGKRILQVDDAELNSEKKPKLIDNWDDSQVDQTIFHQLDVMEGRRKAAEKQELLVKNGKDKLMVKMRKGTLFLKKQQKTRISLESLVKSPRRKHSLAEIVKKGVKKSVVEVTYSNSTQFRFNSSNCLSDALCQNNYDGIVVGDEALVILSDDGSAGLSEICRAFLASPGVDPSLISQEWITNHYQLIVWKLAATERNFPHLFGGVYLTLDNVLLQLKYRYDREIDCCQRSSLRKILETDESAARKMILCVNNVNSAENSTKKDIKLTDGWYSINASIDEEMMSLIDKGRVTVGTKLVVQGCELLNCEQGYDPLHVPNTVQLKLHTNSARRAKWDSRLGFYHIQGSILVQLKDILPKGGNVGQVNVLVARVYPVVYLFKTENGKTVLHSRKKEEQESLLREKKLTDLMEKLQSQVQKEMEEINCYKTKSNVKRKLTNQYTEPFSSHDLMDSEQTPTRDQIDIINNLREREHKKFQETLQQKLNEKLSEAGSEKRNSIPMLKVRIVDPQQSNVDLNSAILTVWRPSEDVETALAERNVVSLYNVTANGKRSGELQLSTGRQTKYSVISKSAEFPRVVYLLSDISRNFNPLFSEIDTVGLVIHIDISSSVETVYLTDQDFNFLGVRFWGGMKKYGWQSCLCVGSEIGCSNLEWRSATVMWYVPYVYVTELSILSSNPRSKHLQEALSQLKMSFKGMDMNEFIAESKEKLLCILRGESGERGLQSMTTKTSTTECPELSKSFKDVIDHEMSGRKSQISKPSSSEITSLNKNVITDVPISNIKSKVLLEKMKKLHGYGSPPPITSMPDLKVSPALKKDFKTPKRKQFDCDKNSNRTLENSF